MINVIPTTAVLEKHTGMYETTVAWERALKHETRSSELLSRSALTETGDDACGLDGLGSLK